MSGIGFTGTRNGMTSEQRLAFLCLLRRLEEATDFHHGDCVGADDEAATMAWDYKLKVICHPPVDESLRAFNKLAHETREPKTHFARNRDIVNETDLLIVCPLQMEHQSHGGTWYTHDYALKQKKPAFVIWPDGRVEQR